MNDQRRLLEVRALPAFLTGTSTEYIGEKPLPRVVRDRPVVFLLGPAGVGKSLVASRLARGTTLLLSTHVLQDALLERVRHHRWSDEVLSCDTLVLDGPVWLHGRPAAVNLLRELLELRGTRRTLVCQADSDASVHLLMEKVPVGQCATLALRFPASRKARLRAAELICRENRIPVRYARRTTTGSDWTYHGVLARIRGPFFSLE